MIIQLSPTFLTQFFEIEEGRRARPRYDVLLRAVAPHAGRPRSCLLPRLKRCARQQTVADTTRTTMLFGFDRLQGVLSGRDQSGFAALVALGLGGQQTVKSRVARNNRKARTLWASCQPAFQVGGILVTHDLCNEENAFRPRGEVTTVSEVTQSGKLWFQLRIFLR